MTERFPWDRFDLVVFDMDGTLYDQGRLRRRMAGLIARDAFRNRSLAAMRTLAAFRRRREMLGGAMAGDFTTAQYELPGHRPDEVRAIVADWMEQRPLALLPGCRAAGAEALFQRLARRHVVAVFSDYRAEQKLDALGLSARLVIAAEDVGRLKPDPAGLLNLMAQAGVSAERTLMIGDRDDRDGEAARRAGVRALIRGRDFHHFDEPLFAHAA
ncbi:MAG TPA: HAD family hydrolase [Sphingobium sp.]|nr:HAD family hydrolase [Sphingobium sp.]